MRLLALDPGTVNFGLVFLVDGELRWHESLLGQKFRKGMDAATKARILAGNVEQFRKALDVIVTTNSPDVLAYELAQANQGPWAAGKASWARNQAITTAQLAHVIGMVNNVAGLHGLVPVTVEPRDGRARLGLVQNRKYTDGEVSQAFRLTAGLPAKARVNEHESRAYGVARHVWEQWQLEQAKGRKAA